MEFAKYCSIKSQAFLYEVIDFLYEGVKKIFY